MVTRFSFEIEFAEDSSFIFSPKFLVLRRLYDHIKHLTCINLEEKCSTCAIKSQCIFYLLSGENFKQYPAIGISRDLADKKSYRKGEKMNGALLLIGNDRFKGYIEGVFASMSGLMGFRVLIKDFSIVEAQRKVIQSLSARLVTPYAGDDLEKQARYYLEAYGEELIVSEIKNIEKPRHVYDKTNYRINGINFHIGGAIGEVVFEKIDSAYLLIGIGRQNFIGGGQLHALED